MWRNLPLAERAKAAANHGFNCVELWDWRGDDIDGLAAACRETGIEIASFFGHTKGGLCNPSQRGEVLRSLTESIAVAERVGARQLFMFSDEIRANGAIRKQDSSDSETKLRSCIDGLRECLKLVEGKPVELMLEGINDVFVPGYFLRDTRQVVSICRELNHPQVVMSFDCYHQQLVGGRLIDNLLEALPFTSAVHIADVPGRHQPGTGEINFHSIKRVLNERGFDRQITFEVDPKNGDSDAAIAAIKEVFPF
jgi:hydroxypyruvate isomerase